MLKHVCSVALLGFAVGGCAMLPDIPPDFVLPVDEILAQAACELRDTLIYLDRSPQLKRFKPREWLITINIAPKVDTNINAAVGWTRKSPFVGSPTRVTTWAISGPGIQGDAKGQRSSGV